MKKASASLTIRNVTVLTPAGDSRVGDLHIAHGRVVDYHDDQGAVNVDGSMLFAVPGMIDMHVHTTSDPSDRLAPVFSDYHDDPAIRALLAAENLGIALRAGITTVRDLGSPGGSGFALRQAWEGQLIAGARPIVAGPAVTALGGHGSWMGLEVGTPAEAARAVRHNISKGAQAIKLVMSSATRTVELSPADLTAAVEEAHWQGVSVAVHANFSERSIDAAVHAGCDSVEHGYAISKRTAAEMRSKGTALCPTLSALTSIVDHPEVFRRRKGQTLVDRARASIDTARDSFSRALAARVTIIAGTDAGVPMVPFDSLPHELELLVEWGLSPSGAFAAATSNAAGVLRRSDLGHLELGAWGDVLLLEADPRDEVRAWREPVLVSQGGQVRALSEPDRTAV